MAQGALSDLKVIEYAQFISGPMCGKLFADMGAEVIKIEPPGGGDEARKHEPFPGDVPHPEKSGLFLYLNTSKKGVTLDLGHPTGVKMFKDLAKEADILIENHAPGHMASLGLGYETLKALNPRLILTSITPFGQTGPYRDWKGPNLVTYMMSLSGYNTPTMVMDPEIENPLNAPGRQAEMMGATAAAASTMLAVFHRQLTGEGQWVDVSCHDAISGTARGEMPMYTYRGIPFSRLRSAQAMPYEPQMCQDGWILALWTEDAHFAALKEILGRPESLESELFQERPGRMANAELVFTLVSEELLKFEREYLVREGQARGLTISPVYTAAQVSHHSHLLARDFFRDIDHPVAGKFRYPGAVARLTETPAIPTRAPLLGEHNEEIFCGRLGYSKEELAKLRTAGVI